MFIVILILICHFLVIQSIEMFKTQKKEQNTLEIRWNYYFFPWFYAFVSRIEIESAVFFCVKGFFLTIFLRL